MVVMATTGLSINMHSGESCQDCVRLLLDNEGNIVNRIMLEPDVEYDPSPLIVAPEGVDGEMGGTYINGVYTPPIKPSV